MLFIHHYNCPGGVPQRMSRKEKTRQPMAPSCGKRPPLLSPHRRLSPQPGTPGTGPCASGLVGSRCLRPGLVTNFHAGLILYRAPFLHLRSPERAVKEEGLLREDEIDKKGPCASLRGARNHPVLFPCSRRSYAELAPSSAACCAAFATGPAGVSLPPAPGSTGGSLTA